MKMRRIAFLTLILAGLGLEAARSQTRIWKPATIPAGYRVETIALPPTAGFSVTGLGFGRDGSVWAASREGEVWRLQGGTWSLFADGLHEPTGLLVDPSGKVFVSQKPELTELVDQDGDGRADEYRSVATEWEISDNYHEYNHGLVRDSSGNLYGALNLTHGGVRYGNGKGGMGHGGRYRGWAYEVTSKGQFKPFAAGLRSPAGIGISPADELFFTDNQGDWIPTSYLAHLQRGQFYGHPVSLRDHPDHDPERVLSLEANALEKMRTPPAVYFPHGELANSPGNPVWDATGGKFGPFSGQVFVGDQSRSNLFRVTLEKVGGAYQGACYNFIDYLQSGAIRVGFSPDGALWVGQSGRGWGSAGGKKFGLQKVTWDGRTTPFSIRQVSLVPGGFRLDLTSPFEGEVSVEDFPVTRWGYHYWSTYGSEKVEETPVPVESLLVSLDRRQVTLQLDLVAGQVYGFDFSKLRNSSGKLANAKAWYTLNRLPGR